LDLRRTKHSEQFRTLQSTKLDVLHTSLSAIRILKSRKLQIDTEFWWGKPFAKSLL